MSRILTALFVLLPTLPSAQVTSRPGVDCALLTAAQARGLVCANAPRPDPPPLERVPTQLDADCVNLDPYAEPERAAACGRRPLPGATTPAFTIGAVYAYGYSSQQAIVLGVTTDVDGVQVVTFRWQPVSGNAGVFAQRTPPAPGGMTNWVAVTR